MSKSNKCYLNNSNVGNKKLGFVLLSLPLPYAGEGGGKGAALERDQFMFSAPPSLTLTLSSVRERELKPPKDPPHEL